MTKRAMVTGASEGIGREFALRLGQEGWAVTAVARNEGRLKALVTELGGGEHGYRVADLSDPAAVDRVAAEFAATHYDLLINNAGVGLYGRFTAIPLAKHKEMLRLNVEAVVTLAHAYLTHARSGDALLNVSSGLGYLPMAAAALYSGTKSLVTTLSQTLWFDQLDRGVYVMGLLPGVTVSQFHVRAGGDPNDTPPAAITQTADQVVTKALKELKKRKHPVVYSGTMNTILITASRLMTRKRLTKIMGSMREAPKKPA